MNVIFFLFATIVCIHQYRISCEKTSLHRSSCRNDVLFKKTDAGKKLTEGQDVILMTAVSLVHCIRSCLRKLQCLSVNYKMFTAGEKNCELQDITKSNSTSVITAASEWSIYQPVSQVRET